MSNRHEAFEQLVTPDGSYTTLLSAKYKNRTAWQKKDPRKIVSFIPGTIMTVDVKPGDTVKEGDILLTFKAMKMHNTYRSPIAGRIAQVCVGAGDSVPKGELLIEFE
ncbi:MAG: acetyl-CoA carboxylase biotin carboxyl carrier protein subunit [Rikenella sp.]|nr:acetyl-CoA carboxylase biotin carboxyl carrier protein subunit [Rikenella sp.]